MKKILTVLIVMIAIFAVAGYSASQQLPEGQASLSDEQLLELALEAARFSGLRGEPTQQTTLKINGNQWFVTMFIPDYSEKPIFILAIKGEIEPGLVVGSSDQYIPEGLTIGLDATNGDLIYVSNRYIDDPIGETTDEDRLLYEGLKDPAFMEYLSQHRPPPIKEPFVIPVMPLP